MTRSDGMVTELKSSNLDLQAAMLRMTVAHEIRRLHGRTPVDPEYVDREEIRARLLKSYQGLKDAPRASAIDEAIESYLSSSYHFWPPSGGLGLLLARWYFRCRKIGYEVGIPMLATILLSLALWWMKDVIVARQLHHAEADTERLVGQLLQTHRALEVQLDHFSESPQIPTISARSQAEYYDFLGRAADELEAAGNFFNRYARQGDVEAGVTPENHDAAGMAAGEVRSLLTSADGFFTQARDLLALEAKLAKISDGAERSMEYVRGADPPALLVERAELAYSKVNAHISSRNLSEARQDLVALAMIARDAVESERLCLEADQLYSSLQTVAAEGSAVALGRRLHQRAQRLAETGDVDRLRGTVQSLSQLGTQLDREYRLVIVGAFWRFKNDNSGVRNYYLRVQAIDTYGNPLAMSIRNDKTGQTRRVREWGERVSKAVYDRVGADKADNGVIDEDLLGTKQRGYLTVERKIPDVGQITSR